MAVKRTSVATVPFVLRKGYTLEMGGGNFVEVDEGAETETIALPLPIAAANAHKAANVSEIREACGISDEGGSFPVSKEIAPDGVVLFAPVRRRFSTRPVVDIDAAIEIANAEAEIARAEVERLKAEKAARK